ncbi:uncharacterized protein LOC129600307 [Paramacrobiotus metropolitanus]|uniref:uncharacterized protein LOC129600307 n=1 Tax=Paramacrobiotus metropolitanus TaxID=2943436 RepID=UPI0024458E09|nr:uncharacterized protein LOC129600307 [Paramacrobiotus metropolitanus]
MNATSFYLRQLYSGRREVNYGNTVLVRRSNGKWWLGYVQDIDGDQFFVDFDASTISAQWIHSRAIWPHYFLGNVRPYYGSSVQVAVRDVENGPLVFRSGTIIEGVCSGTFVAVRLMNRNPRSVESPCFVHSSQLVSKLPVPDKDPNFFGKCKGFVYRKHVIGFEQAHLLRDVRFLPKYLLRTCRLKLDNFDRGCNASCRLKRCDITESYTIRFQCLVHQRDHELDVSCRMFAKLGTDSVKFVCGELHGDAAGCSMIWNTWTLTEACRTCLSEQQLGMAGQIIPVNCGITTSQLDEGEINITDFPHPIVSQILYNLDIVTRYVSMRRVCALWRILLQEHAADHDIVFDVHSLCFKRPSDREFSVEYVYFAHKIVVLLKDFISPYTRTLIFTDDSQQHHHYTNRCNFQQALYESTQILKLKAVRLPLLIVKNGGDVAEDRTQCFLSITRNAQGQFGCQQLAWLGSVCDELLLINYTASIPSACNSLLTTLFYHVDHTWLDDGHMMRRQDESAHLNVVIPFLRFRRTETPAEQCRRFVASVNERCPAVSPEVYAKVKGVHARWVQTLCYPFQWTGIRMFLDLFSCARPGSHPQRWTGVDLRQLDVTMLSPLALHILDGYFAD